MRIADALVGAEVREGYLFQEAGTTIVDIDVSLWNTFFDRKNDKATQKRDRPRNKELYCSARTAYGT